MRLVRRVRVAAIVVTGVLLCGSGVAVATVAGVTKGSLPSKTSADVASLTAKEQAVINQLNDFKHLGAGAPVTSWEAGLKVKEAAQSRAEASVNADLTPRSPSKLAAHPSSTLAFRDDNGVKYSVTLVNVIDPARGADQFTTPQSGYRFVATLFRITDTGNGATSDDANSDATVIGSNDQTYSADFNDVAECTNFNSGSYQLDPGQSATGCVVFQVPNGVGVKRVDWSPSGGFGASFGEWNIVG